MEQAPTEVLKVMDKALEEGKVVIAKAKAAKPELVALKGKKVLGELEHSRAVVPVTKMAGRSHELVKYLQLNRKNYTLWEMQMYVALQSAGVWMAVHSEDVGFETDRHALLAIY